MICCAEQVNQLKPAGGNSGLKPFCTATSAGFFIGDCQMKQIPLTQGKFAIVDDKDFEKLNSYRWCACFIRANWYVLRHKKGECIRMHRQILNAPKKLVVDHINHNGLDNRKSNLRLCTIAENQRNRLPNKKGTSVYKGVHWYSRIKRWSTRMRYNGRVIFLGNYVDEILAAEAYDKKAKELHKEFAHLNFKETN